MKLTRPHFKSSISTVALRAPARLASSTPSTPSTSSTPSSSQSAFTMIEIAIALGVIGFALVVIIGILPAGLTVQRESHQDTVIGQDGPFFLEAIRNGGPPLPNGASTSLDFLTNYVESITIIKSGSAAPLIYTNDPKSANYISNGQMILGLLSTPEIYPPVYGTNVNSVTARIRGLTGAATEQRGSNAATAFRYYMNVELVPFNATGNSISYQSTDFLDYTNNPNGIDYLTRLERAEEVPYLVNNLYDLRLKFSWPIRPNGTAGQNRQAYRSLVSAHLLFNTNHNVITWFFQPNNYSTNDYLGL